LLGDGGEKLKNERRRWAMEDRIVKCKDCGVLISKKDGILLEGGAEWICEKCYENYILCSNCLRYVNVNEALVYENSYGNSYEEIKLCGKCKNQYDFCVNCGNLVPKNDGFKLEDGFKCTNCAAWDPRLTILLFHPNARWEDRLRP
jgi:hypothetical protein